MKFKIVFLTVFLIFTAINCNSQTSSKDRQPYAAGRFYPDDSAELSEMLESCFTQLPINKK